MVNILIYIDLLHCRHFSIKTNFSEIGDPPEISLNKTVKETQKGPEKVEKSHTNGIIKRL